MNERIKEIARQATKDVEARPDTGICSMEKYNARFAELIVRECCDIFVELRTRPADLAVLDVKKHFGVKE